MPAIGPVTGFSKIYTSKSYASDKKAKGVQESSSLMEGGDVLDGKAVGGVRFLLRVVRRRDQQGTYQRNKTPEERAAMAKEVNRQAKHKTENTQKTRVDQLRERFVHKIQKKGQSNPIRDVKPVMQKFPGLNQHYLMWPLRQKVRGWEIGPCVLLFTQGRKKRRLVIRGRRRHHYDEAFSTGESFVVAKSILMMVQIEISTQSLTDPAFYPPELKSRQATYETIMEFPTSRLLRGQASFPEQCDHFVESVVGNRNRVSSSALTIPIQGSGN